MKATRLAMNTMVAMERRNTSKLVHGLPKGACQHVNFEHYLLLFHGELTRIMVVRHQKDKDDQRYEWDGEEEDELLVDHFVEESWISWILGLELVIGRWRWDSLKILVFFSIIVQKVPWTSVRWEHETNLSSYQKWSRIPAVQQHSRTTRILFNEPREQDQINFNGNRIMEIMFICKWWFLVWVCEWIRRESGENRFLFLDIFFLVQGTESFSWTSEQDFCVWNLFFFLFEKEQNKRWLAWLDSMKRTKRILLK